MINLLKVARYIRDHRTLEADYTSDFTTCQLEAFRRGVLDGMGDYMKRPTVSHEYKACDYWYRYYNLGEKSAYWNATHEHIYFGFETLDCNCMYEYGVRISMSGFEKVTYRVLCHSISKIYIRNEYRVNKIIKGMISACGADLYDILDDWASNYNICGSLINSLVQSLIFMNYLNKEEFNLYKYVHKDCKSRKFIIKQLFFDLNYRFSYSDYSYHLIWLKTKDYISWTAYAYLTRKAKIRLKEYLR